MLRFFLMGGLTLAVAATDAPGSSPRPEVGNTPIAGSAQPIHLQAPASFPASARKMLDQRMNEHADQLEWLLSAALMLNYDLAETAATNLANDPKLAGPSAGDLDTLNALLPKKFFMLQAQLAERARDVAAAAKTHDNGKLGRALGRLTETCVACHSVYLYGAEGVGGDQTGSP
jgi:hypothetical protein